MNFDLRHGDCLQVLATLPDACVDAVVTDPPYGLAFMGKAWDYDVPSVDIWTECLRVLKPGGHLLAFAGTRTQHRMAVNIEDAGFEIRDMIAWVYGSGFPKSLDVSKAIDKAAGAEREVVGTKLGQPGYSAKSADEGNCYGDGLSNGEAKCLITAPATPEAQQWAGWGTALKPSFETVTWARKPIDPMGYCSTILESLLQIEAQCLQHASDAARSSKPSLVALPGERIGSAPGPAAIPPEGDPGSRTATGEAGATSSPVDTSASTLAAASIALSIVSSWRHTLEGVCAREKTSTTETESKTTTDWKTLSFCLSQITPENIIQACSVPGGFSANASTAAQIFNASLALLQATHTLSAIEPATWQALDACQGEAVSPSLDPMIMARKPFKGTVAANVLRHGTGGLNVDECRVGTEDLSAQWDRSWNQDGSFGNGKRASQGKQAPPGRWPSNLIHDGSDEVVGLFPANAGASAPVKGTEASMASVGAVTGKRDRVPGAFHADTGSAARFFYTPKASTAERQGVTHPTVKPLDLMAYLCRLITPPNGTILDPFMGSGTTIKAAMSEGFKAIGIERDPDYFAMAQQRLNETQLGFQLL